MDWSAPMMSAQRQIKEAEQILLNCPHGQPDRRQAAEIEAAYNVEHAMVQLARVLGSLQR